MNFDKILFLLLIIKTLYRCGFSEITLLVPLTEIIVLNGGNTKYTTAQFGQYDNEDNFCILDPQNQSLYVNYFVGDFTSKSIEFIRLYDNVMEFLFRRADNQILWFKCVFSGESLIQAFFRSIYSYQEKGNGVNIFRISRYFNASGHVERWVKHAHLYSKNIPEFANKNFDTTYFITHYTDVMSGMFKVDIIFRAQKFAISKIYQNDKIALCIDGIPDIRILISFTSRRDCQRFLATHMPKPTQSDNISCEFPTNLSSDQIFESLDQP